MNEKKKHSEKLDHDQLHFAMTLIKGVHPNKDTIEILNTSLHVMQFGQISIQDMLDFIEAVGDGE